jgi:hypothetical protein
VFGLLWNCGEIVVSLLLAALGGIFVFAGWIVGAFILVSILTLAVVAALRGFVRLSRRTAQPAAS